MKYNIYNIIIVCNNYSKRLKTCLYYWSLIDYPKKCYNIYIITNSLDENTKKVVNIYKKTTNLNLYLIINTNISRKNYKSFLIEKALKNNVDNKANFIILSDADMIFYQDFLEKINLAYQIDENQIISSQREDISDIDIELFFKEYNKHKTSWIWENIKREVISSSPFMGWFLSFPSTFISQINFYPNHEGYDEFDWRLYGQLVSLGLKEKKIEYDNIPLHIYHGKKGNNWNGTELIF